MPKRSLHDDVSQLSQSPDLMEEDLVEDSEADGGADAVWPVRQAKVDLAQQGSRLDQFLVGLAPDFSRSYLKTLVESGLATVDGKSVSSASKKVVLGQLVELTLKPTPQSLAFTAEPMDLDVVFEDAHLLVVNKPAGMVVHPAAGNWTGTLMNGLLAHHPGAVELPRAGIVHRLDKDTSGLMVVGKTIPAVTALSRAIAARDVSRQYIALVHGAPRAAFSVDLPVGRDPVSRVKMAVVSGGREARTDVRCLMTAELADSGCRVSAVRCALHTGRTHQIRVHMSSQKYPLIADALYGGMPALGMLRQALHATRLSLRHPVSGAEMVWEAGLPPDMQSAWDQMAAAPQIPIRDA